ncbi:MAG TPA: DUF4349 domain-containing protein [Symbiobacteriaceae bacterium]|nr:DUF4349 domain-containing protein [Symbiobacteriaceae bacterium]
MTERKRRALTDLRPVAEQTLFADLRVTPELKAKLRRRIETASAPAAPKAAPARSPWLRWGAVSGLAAAAMLTFALFGQLQMPKQVEEEGKPAVAAQTSPPMMDTYKYKGEPTVTAAVPGSTGAPKVDTIIVTAADRAAPTVNFTSTTATSTAYGNAVTTTVTDGNGSAVQVSGVEAQPGRKIVLNAEYDLQVTEAVTAMQRLQSLAATTAGYVVDAQLVKGGDGSWAGRLTLRLPSGQYNGAIQEIRRIGEVRQERQWSQDVTERYYDLEARIRIQEEYERKLQELAGKAATFDDWMKLTRQINDTRALIEQMEGSLKLLANQVEYSTINITFTQPAPGKEPPPKPPEPAKGLGPSMARAFQASVQWFADLGQAILVGAAAIAPFLVAFLVLGVLSFLAWRRFRGS